MTHPREVPSTCINALYPAPVPAKLWLPYILTLADTLSPPLPPRVLPTKPRPRAMIKNIRLVLLTFIDRLVNACISPVRWEG